MNVYQAMVHEFHQATDSVIGTTPELRSSELRARLIMEEAVETVAAMGFAVKADIYKPTGAFAFDDKDHVAHFSGFYLVPNFEDVIDGYCDLLYVVFGSAVTDGIDLDPFFAEVHRANMEKATGPKREDGKQLKPEDWKPPDIEGQLARAQMDAEIRARMEQHFWDGFKVTPHG